MTRKTPLTVKLAEHGVNVAASNRRAREAELALSRITGETKRLSDAITDAYADGDERRAAAASKERAALDANLREHEERLEGARRAGTKAEAERAAFATLNVDGLIAEREPDARAVAALCEDVVEQLAQAQARWNAVEAEVAGLLRLAGRDAGTLPTFPAALATLVRDARRAGDLRVPPPLPGGQSMVPVRSEPVIPASLPQLDPQQKPPKARKAA